MGHMVMAKQRVLQKLGEATSKGYDHSPESLHDAQEKDRQWELFTIHAFYITKGKQMFTEPSKHEDFTLKCQQEQFRADLYKAYLDFNPEDLNMDMATQAIIKFVTRLTPVDTTLLRPVPLLAFPDMNPIYSQYHPAMELLSQPTSAATTSGVSLAGASALLTTSNTRPAIQIPVFAAHTIPACWHQLWKTVSSGNYSYRWYILTSILAPLVVDHLGSYLKAQERRQCDGWLQIYWHVFGSYYPRPSCHQMKNNVLNQHCDSSDEHGDCILLSCIHFRGQTHGGDQCCYWSQCQGPENSWYSLLGC